MAYIDPRWVIADLLRTNLTDPRARAETSNSDSFTATASQTNFELSPSTGSKVSAITEVTVATVAQAKWAKYTVNFEDGEIDFLTGLTVGQAVVVTYKEGTTNWIYPAKPNEKLTNSSWPRISITVMPGSAERLGNYDASVDTAMRIQVDVFTKEKADDQIWEIDDKKYGGEKLATYLAYQVMQALEDNEEDFFPILDRYVPLGPPRDMPFDDTYQSHHKIFEFMLSGVQLGRV